LFNISTKFSNSDNYFEFYLKLPYEKDFNFLNLKSSKDFLKLLKEALNRNYSTLNADKLKENYSILTIAYLVSLGIKKNNHYLSQLQKYCLYNISVRQLVDGLDAFYQDFRNRDIKIGDAIYIVKRQIIGEDEEVIKRIIKYLKTKNPLYMFYEKNGQIYPINFPP